MSVQEGDANMAASQSHTEAFHGGTEVNAHQLFDKCAATITIQTNMWNLQQKYFFLPTVCVISVMSISSSPSLT